MKRQHKYNAKRTNGSASKAEAKRKAELRWLERAGEIHDLRCQVKIPLMGQNGPILTPTGRHAHYVADFVYYEDGRQIIEDKKGFKTPEYKLKKGILRAMGLEITET